MRTESDTIQNLRAVLVILTFLVPSAESGEPAVTVLGARVLDVPDIDERRNYVVIHESSGRVLSPAGNSLHGGTGVSVSEFDGTTAQLWAFEKAENDAFRLRNAYGGHWLGPDSARERLSLSHGESGNPDLHHSWTIDSAGPGLFHFRNVQTGRALSAYPESRDASDVWTVHEAVASGHEEPDFRLQGWATRNGGTTGGQDGETVVVKTIADLIDALDADEPRIVHVVGRLDYNDLDRSDVRWRDNHRIRPKSDKSVLGIGAGAEIANAEIRLSGQRNLIIRNIRFSNSPDTAIAVSNNTTNVWIDHCEFVGSHDGAIDFSTGADFVTVSWCRFFDERKVHIVGSFPGDWHEGSFRVTFHHNWYGNNIESARNPAISKSDGVHIFNCLYLTPRFGMRFGDKNLNPAKMQVVSEANYFAATEPWWIQVPELDNKRFVDRGSIIRRPGVPPYAARTLRSEGITFHPEHEYDYTLNHVLNVPDLVMQYSGTGIIDPRPTISRAPIGLAPIER